MTTSTRLWLGFGALAALLVLSGGAIVFRIRNIDEQVREMEFARRLHDAATQLEIRTTHYGLGVRTYVQTGETTARQTAIEDAATVEQLLVECGRQATNERQQQLADRLASRWRGVREQGDALLDTGGGQSRPEELKRLFDHRVGFEKLLEDELQVETRARYDARADAVEKEVQSIVGFVLILLGLGVALAFVTSLMVVRGVVKAEGVVRANRELLRVTLASIADAVITTDAAGRIAYLNAAAESLTGWKNDEAAGQPLDAVFRTTNEAPRPTVEPRGSGEIAGSANQTMLLAKDGTERAIDDTFAPIQYDRSEAAGAVLTFRDVTERRRAQAARNVSEVRYRRLFESAMDGILLLDADTGRITDANPFIATLLDCSRADLLGQELWQVGIYKDAAASRSAVRELQEKRFLREVDLPLQTARGLRIDLELVGSLYTEGNELVIQCNIRDVTERKRLEDELRKTAAELSDADRRKNEFLAMLAHELRNPLAPIRNAVRVIQVTGGNSDAVVSATAMIERQIAQLVRLVDDLLDINRISRGKIQLRCERVELALVIHHAVEAWLPVLEALGQDLAVTLSPEPVYLNADPTRLAQIVGNLLNNASKFTGKEGRIRLTVEREGAQVAIRLRDSGIGIAPAQLPRIFEMFIQLDNSLERPSSGLGIGLALVKRLVELHDGTVEARSAGVGQGSEFVVRLPMLTDDPKPPPHAPTASAPTPAKTRRILVVDDNRDSATSLTMLLKLTGNETQAAYDGLQAVEAAATFHPDVILLDIGLPKLNGYEAARRIREQPWSRGMLLVAVTGWGQEEARGKAREAGFDALMVKPVEHAQLLQLLTDLTSGRSPA